MYSVFFGEKRKLPDYTEADYFAEQVGDFVYAEIYVCLWQAASPLIGSTDDTSC